MSLSTNSSHIFKVLPQIPPQDYDENELCFLSHKSHRELNSEKQVVQLKCNNISKYLDLEFCLNWIEYASRESLCCPQCRARLDLRDIRELKFNQLLNRREALKNQLRQVFEQAKELELTGSKVEDYILLFGFHRENTFQPFEELAKINVTLCELELDLIEQQIIDAQDIDPNLNDEEFEKRTRDFFSLRYQREDLLFRLSDAISYHSTIVEDFREDTESFELALQLRHLSNGELLNESKTLITLFSLTLLSAVTFFPLAVPGLAVSFAATKIRSTNPLQELIRRALYNPQSALPDSSILERL